MHPISLKTELAISEAIRCAEYRLGDVVSLPPIVIPSAVGLRFGLLTAAAIEALAAGLGAEQAAELVPRWRHRCLGAALQVHSAIERRFQSNGLSASGKAAAEACEHYIEVCDTHLNYLECECLNPFCIRLVAERFSDRQLAEVEKRTLWLLRRHISRSMQASTAQTLRYAYNLYERRRLGLREVPEIALLGE